MSKTYLTQALHRAKRQYPNRLATVFGDRKKTYAEIADRVARLAGALQQLGMGPGDRVGVLSLNSDRYLELYFAIWWGGGVVNPVNIRWSPAEITYSLDNCQTHILVVDDAFAPMVESLSERSQALRTIIHASDSEARSGMFDYERLIAEHAPVPDAIRCNSDLAGVYYTGGTTGFPKGVMLSHDNLHSGGIVTLLEGMSLEGDVGLHAAPMFHLADGMFTLSLSMRGCTQVIIPMFQVEAVLKAIESNKVTVALFVPTMIQMLVDAPTLSQYQLESLKRVFYGASPISEGLLDRTMQCLPNIQFTQAYGQTESSAVVSILHDQFHRGPGRKLRSAGRSSDSVEIKIVNSDCEEVAHGTVGEIAVRSAGVMLGYWKNEEQTASVLKSGWLLTGDGAYMDDDGFIFIVDRVKDMIVSGGENVYSAEVENAISQHPAVAACAVIGVPSEQWGESVHAVVVCKSGAQIPTAAELQAHCQTLIAGYKCPRSMEVRDALPLSGAGKVLKIELRAPYWKEQQRRVG